MNRSQNSWKKAGLVQFRSGQRPACPCTELAQSGGGGASVSTSAEADCRPSVNVFNLYRTLWASGLTQIGESFRECQPGSMRDTTPDGGSLR